MKSKARVFPVTAEQIAQSRGEQYMLPCYGDLLTFSLSIDAAEKITVNWSEDKGHKRSGTYYKLRGFFKRLNREKEPSKSYWTGDWNKAWNNSGGYREVDVYVAEDYLHPAFQSGLPTWDKHLLNLPGTGIGDENKPALTLNWTKEGEVVVTENWHAEDGWAKLTCTEELFYGQSSSKESRFIVYHPARDIFQGRFNKDKTQVFLETAASKIPEIKIPFIGMTLIKMDEAKAATLGSLLLSVMGHSLRQFVYPEINDIVPEEWKRKATSGDKDLSKLPVAVIASAKEKDGDTTPKTFDLTKT